MSPSPRKKWRLKLYPSFHYVPHPSMRKAYQDAIYRRGLYLEGMSPTHQVDIEVDEGDGHGWQTYEVCEFPEREAAPPRG